MIEPAAHLLQSAALLEPVVPMYVPASQSVQAATFDAVEYLPTAHSVHVVAPVPVPVLVIEPAAQSVHDVAMFELIEYLPAMHAVQGHSVEALLQNPLPQAWHVISPVTSSRRAARPASQATHAVRPSFGISPEGQIEQLPASSGEYRPFAHSSHCVPSSLLRVPASHTDVHSAAPFVDSETRPAGQRLQRSDELAPSAALNRPLLQGRHVLGDPNAPIVLL